MVRAVCCEGVPHRPDHGTPKHRPFGDGLASSIQERSPYSPSCIRHGCAGRDGHEIRPKDPVWCAAYQPHDLPSSDVPGEKTMADAVSSPDSDTSSSIAQLSAFSKQNMANQIALGEEQTKDSLQSSEGKAYHIQ